MKERVRRLEMKTVGALAVVLTLVFGANTWTNLTQFRSVYLAQTRDRAQMLADMIVARTEPLLASTGGSSEQLKALVGFPSFKLFFKELIERNRGVTAAAIFDASGAFLAHTDGAIVGKPAPAELLAATRAGVPDLVSLPGAYALTLPIMSPSKERIAYAVVTLSDAEIRATISRTIWMAFGLLVGSLLASALVATYLTRKGITGPLTRVTTMIQDIAEGEGDLTKRVAVTSRDEIGEVARWFNVFQDKLHEIIARLNGASDRLGAASEELAAGAREMAKGAGDQSSLAGQVASAVEEMSATVTDVGRNAQGVAQAAKGAQEVASKGGEVVTEAVGAMKRIAGAVEEMATTLAGLRTRSEQIGKIIEVIDDIADQTNLLALNAAIEAARAGEQGRGFAVVADEVRRLAERTSRATKEIAEMIHAIQAEASGVTVSMETGQREAETGVQLAGRAGEALSQIIEVVSGVMTQIQHIATAAEQQSTAAETIATNVSQVAVISKQTAAGASSTAQATQELTELAEQIRTTVGRFKLRAA